MEDIIKQKLVELRKALAIVHSQIANLELTDISNHPFSDKELSGEIANLFNSISVHAIDIPTKVAYLTGMYYKEKDIQERIQERHFLVPEGTAISFNFLSSAWIGRGEYLTKEAAETVLQKDRASQMRRYKKVRSIRNIFSFDPVTKTYKKVPLTN